MVSSTVTVLTFKGQLQLNPDPLSDIYVAQGEDAAEDTVCRTLSDIAHRLSELKSKRDRGLISDIPMGARRIAAISGQIGLVELSMAAEHVATASVQKDAVAIEATFSRLERCFDLAMTEVWDFQASY